MASGRKRTESLNGTWTEWYSSVKQGRQRIAKDNYTDICEKKGALLVFNRKSSSETGANPSYSHLSHDRLYLFWLSALSEQQQKKIFSQLLSRFQKGDKKIQTFFPVKTLRLSSSFSLFLPFSFSFSFLLRLFVSRDSERSRRLRLCLSFVSPSSRLSLCGRLLLLRWLWPCLCLLLRDGDRDRERERERRCLDSECERSRCREEEPRRVVLADEPELLDEFDERERIDPEDDLTEERPRSWRSLSSRFSGWCRRCRW